MTRNKQASAVPPLTELPLLLSSAVVEYPNGAPSSASEINDAWNRPLKLLKAPLGESPRRRIYKS